MRLMRETSLPSMKRLRRDSRKSICSKHSLAMPRATSSSTPRSRRLKVVFIASWVKRCASGMGAGAFIGSPASIQCFQTSFLTNKCNGTPARSPRGSETWVFRASCSDRLRGFRHGENQRQVREVRPAVCPVADFFKRTQIPWQRPVIGADHGDRFQRCRRERPRGVVRAMVPASRHRGGSAHRRRDCARPRRGGRWRARVCRNWVTRQTAVRAASAAFTGSRRAGESGDGETRQQADMRPWQAGEPRRLVGDEAVDQRNARRRHRRGNG